MILVLQAPGVYPWPGQWYSGNGASLPAIEYVGDMVGRGLGRGKQVERWVYSGGLGDSRPLREPAHAPQDSASRENGCRKGI